MGAAWRGVVYTPAMRPRARRALVVFAVTAAGYACFETATSFEQGAIAAQAPAIAAAGTAARHVDREQLMRDLTALADPAFEGRRTSSSGGLKARTWIAAQFAAIGLDPPAGGYLQKFQFTHRSIRGLLLPGRPFRTDYRDAANVIGVVNGSGATRTIVVTAHYDHIGVRDGQVHPGADDNASGVAAMLAVARHFRSRPSRHRLVFVAFDAEELGLRGAETFVDSPLADAPAIAINVNLDMVSRSDWNEIFAAGTYQSPWLRPILEDIQRRSAVRILFGHDRPPIKAGGVEDWTSQSDHGVFHAAGIPFLYFGVADHADYHEPGDTADKVDKQFFGNVADMIVETVVTLDRQLR